MLSRTHRNLWKIGGLLATFITALLIGNALLPPDRAVTRKMIGHDFLVFYSAGTLARTGQYQKLYDVPTLDAMENHIGRTAGLDIGKTYGPWWNPPWAAWFFAPLTVLPFSQALALWMLLSTLALAASLIILSRFFPAGTTWKTWLLVPIFLYSSGPFWGVVSHGQNTFLSLLILSAAVALWRANRNFTAGLILGLLAYKPQLAAVAGAALILHRGWRPAAGLVLTGLITLIVTLTAMPGILTIYLHQLPANIVTAQELNRYFWDRHVTLKSFWRLLFQGTNPGPLLLSTRLLWYACEATLGTFLTLSVLRARRDTTKTDTLIAATIAAAPLLMPFYFDYDLTLLIIPAVLTTSDAITRGTDRKLLWSWVTLFGILLISTQVAGKTHFIPAVPAIACVSTLLIRRTLHSPQPTALDHPQTSPLAIAA